MTPRIVVLEERAGLGLRRVRWRDRLLARARASALDHDLAAGASPDSNVPLAVHAGRLCKPEQRRLLARSLARLVAAADAPTARRLRAPVCRPAVQGARAELAAVAGRLRGDRPRRRARGGPDPDPARRRDRTALPFRWARAAPERTDRGPGRARLVRLNATGRTRFGGELSAGAGSDRAGRW